MIYQNSFECRFRILDLILFAAIQNWVAALPESVFVSSALQAVQLSLDIFHNLQRYHLVWNKVWLGIFLS